MPRIAAISIAGFQRIARTHQRRNQHVRAELGSDPGRWRRVVLVAAEDGKPPLSHGAGEGGAVRVLRYARSSAAPEPSPRSSKSSASPLLVPPKESPSLSNWTALTVQRRVLPYLLSWAQMSTVAFT